MLRPKLNRIWANDSSTLRRDPGDAKYLQGWISEIPTYQVLNFLQWKVDTTILAIAERGIPEWGTDVQYGLGSLVWDESTGFIYVATVAQPSRLTKPSENAGHWSQSSIQITRKEFDDIVAAITAHIANKSNPHGLTAGQLNAYNKAEMDALVLQYRTIVDNHARDKDNPHNTTAEKAGAVPVTGGKYTGPVTFVKSLIMNADDTARLCNENGLYLEIGPQAADVAVVGITTSGDVVAGRKNSKSKIVTEKTFQDLKAINEPEYAVPMPCFQMNMVYDINVQVGSAEVDSGNTSPTFDAANGGLVSGNIASDILSSIPVLSGVGFTVACEIKMSHSPSQETTTVFRVGTYDVHIFGNRAGHIGAYVRDDSFGVSAFVGRSTKAVLSVDSAGIVRVYAGGVLIGTGSKAVSTAALDLRAFIQLTISPISYTLRNFQIWPVCLTDKQISTL